MMEFYCYELKKTVKAKHRPIIIITSNNEKELPDAFLRRCFFHYISFPERETLKSIVKVHYPKLENKLIENAMNVFYDLREIDGLKKKPSTSELIDWIKLLIVGKVTESELGDVDLSEELPLLAGALLKNEQDHDLLTRIRLRFRR
jgi:MoxR-like ATPase